MMGQLETMSLLSLFNELGDKGETSITLRGGVFRFEITRFTAHGRVGVSQELSIENLMNAGDDLLLKTLRGTAKAMDMKDK